MEEFAPNNALDLSIISRRLRGLAMISRGIVPNLVISQRVVDKVADIARQFIADETGESMLGFVLDGIEQDEMPTIYVIDTISPDEEATLRQTHTFQQGDDLQDEIIWWLQENWRLCRENNRHSDGKPLEEKWQTPLRYLGDWHKQPGFMIQPSGGDLMTALNWLDDPENMMDYLLVPIVTLGHESVTDEEGANVNYFNVPMEDGTSLRMDWWYIHRDVRVFQPITPTIMPTSDLPTLTHYPWHLTKPDRMAEEVGHMTDDSMFVEAIVWQADDDIPMELCFFAVRPGGKHVMLVATEHDYPKTPPRLQLAPYERFDPNDDFYDIFERFWLNSEVVETPKDFEWSIQTPLIDFIYEMEDHLGIKRPDIPKPTPPESTAVSVPIELDDEPTSKPSEVAESTDDVDTDDTPTKEDDD